MSTFMAYFSQILLLVLGVFLMIIVLLQRGRGGGLAGAFGGMGGQSAFGTKAGDVFTRITIVIAVLWVVVAGGSGFFLRAAAEQEGKSRLENEVDLEEDADAEDSVLDLDGPVIPPDPPQPPVGATTDEATEQPAGTTEADPAVPESTTTPQTAPQTADPATPEATTTDPESPAETTPEPTSGTPDQN